MTRLQGETWWGSLGGLPGAVESWGKVEVGGFTVVCRVVASFFVLLPGPVPKIARLLLAFATADAGNVTSGTIG